MIDEKIAENEIRLQNSTLNSRGNNVQNYKGRALAIETAKQDGTDESTECNVDELIATTENGFIEIYMSCVENPDRFWVQIFGPKGVQLDRLSDTMTDFYEVAENKIRTTMSNMPLKVGDIVAAPYNLDANYYRVRVVSINEDDYAPEETPVRVFYLDFGDEASHPKKDLCALKEEYLNFLPFQAIECRLDGVKPKDSAGWSDEAIKFLTETTYAAQWQTILAKPVKKLEPEAPGKPAVTLVELIDVKNRETELNIAEALVANEFAVKVVTDEELNGGATTNETLN